MSDEPGAACPTCGADGERQLSGGAGFLFKGSGFYITDSRSDDYKKRASESESSQKESSVSSGSEKTGKQETGGDSSGGSSSEPSASKPAGSAKKAKGDSE